MKLLAVVNELKIDNEGYMGRSKMCHVLSSELRVGMYIAKLDHAWIDHPFIRTNFLIRDARDLARLIDAGIQEVWIDETKGISKPKQLKTEQKEEVPAVMPVPLPETEGLRKAGSGTIQKRLLKKEIQQARQICLDTKEQVESMFQDVRLGKTVDKASTVPLVQNIIDSVSRNPSAIITVARLKNHDNYTYMHSVAVCALMVALARQLKLDDMQTIVAGQAGLLHDLGKAFMPLDILNKPGRLTDEEFEIIKQHPIAGARALVQQNEGDVVYDVVLHHHEKIDGTGYPDKLKDEEISLFAKMAACCDVYDAVTSLRAYKEPWSPAYALQKMAQWKGQFDKTIFQAFVKSVGIYPVGSLVRLSSERLAVVTEPSEHSLLTPVVCEFFSIKAGEMIPMKIIDLSDEKQNIKIVGPENPDKWGFTDLDALWQ